MKDCSFSSSSWVQIKPGIRLDSESLERQSVSAVLILVVENNVNAVLFVEFGTVMVNPENTLSSLPFLLLLHFTPRQLKSDCQASKHSTSRHHSIV